MEYLLRLPIGSISWTAPHGLLTFITYIFFIILLQLSHFPPFIPLHPAPLLPPAFPPLQFMSMGHTCKFFEFYISSTILNPPPCLFSTYHLCYLLSVPFLLLSPSNSLTDEPPGDLHFCVLFLF